MMVLTLPALLVACGDDAEPAAQITSAGPSAQPSPEPTREPAASLLPERVPPSNGSDSAVTGEVPAQLLDDILDQASARTGVPVADIAVVRSQQVEWSDGSLGCPEPGRTYTQALVPGFWVVLDAAGTELDYRANDEGYVVRCEQPTRTAPAPSTDS